MAKGRNNWTREQSLAALALYCQLPFGQMHARCAAVVELATRVGRTPDAVAMKLGNFASLDPAHKARGVAGLPHVAALDRELWNEYHGSWNVLANSNLAQPVAEIEEVPIEATETTATVRRRVGQSFFRNCVLGAYESKCCLTGIAAPELLRASHIIPWSASEARRLDPHNGLCLNALHDAAFDRGLITFDAEFRCAISPELEPQIPEDVFATFFEVYRGKPLTTPTRFAPARECLEWHRDNAFHRG
jgi:putative restriction endonuclease